MRVLCGTDIIEISRIQKSIERTGKRFLEIVYTPVEIEYCESKNRAKYCHYAGRFAAKEAIYKAVSGLLKERFSISWQNAQVINDENGNPKSRIYRNRNTRNKKYRHKYIALQRICSSKRSYYLRRIITFC